LKQEKKSQVWQIESLQHLACFATQPYWVQHL